MSQKRIGILSKNSTATLNSIFEVIVSGNSAVLLNTRLTPDDWKNQLSAAQCESCIIDPEFAEQLVGISLKEIQLPKKENEWRHCGTSLMESETNREAVVLFTSGSLGHSKGVRISLGALLESARATNTVLDITDRDSWLLSLPLYHAGGLLIPFRCLVSNAKCIIPDSPSPEDIWKALQLHSPGVLSLVPSVLEMLLNQYPESIDTLSQMKCILLGGSRMSETLPGKIRELNLPVATSYGMTETVANITCLDPNTSKNFLHTSGRAVPGVQIQISEQGKILVQSSRFMNGYLSSEIAQNSWFDTGDLGELTENGYLIVHGREADLCISGGENISLSEIEKVAEQHPIVQNAIVLATHDQKWGERPVLFIENKSESIYDEKEFKGFLLSKLAKIKVPDEVIVLEKFPRNETGKIDRKSLMKNFI